MKNYFSTNQKGFTPLQILQRRFSFFKVLFGNSRNISNRTSVKFTTGFTLIETLVGLFIFVMAFVVLSTVSGGSLQDINLTKRRLTAQYLAEEGVEYIKYIQKSSTDSADFTSKVSLCTSGDGCDAFIDVFGNNVAIVPYDPGLNLMYCTYGLITHKANPLGCSPESEYSRSITVEDFSSLPNSNSFRVTSTVAYDITQPPIIVSAMIHFDLP